MFPMSTTATAGAAEPRQFAFTDEHEEFRRHVRRFMESRSPSTAVRQLIADERGHDPDVWVEMATQLGLQGLIIPECFGGSGFSFVELSIALEESGRMLLCAPLLSTAIATLALISSGDERAAERYLPPIARGELVATLALAGDEGVWDGTDGATAVRSRGQWSLHGHQSFVADGQAAGLIIIAAETEHGPQLFAVDADAAGVTRVALPSLDLTRRLARVTFNGAQAQALGPEGRGSAALERSLDLACIALACEQVGGAQRAHEMSLSYARDRVQFGRPIGGFQAIKHACAEMLVEVELARSLAYGAAWLADDERQRPILAPMVKAYCSEAFVKVATSAIQIHGGTGFTWEHDAHLYFRRAKSTEQYLGDPPFHRERYAARIGV